jgi:hypothetical protein
MLRDGTHLKSLPGFREPQGIASVPDAKMIAVANGQGTGLQVIDAGDYRFAKAIPTTCSTTRRASVSTWRVARASSTCSMRECQQPSHDWRASPRLRSSGNGACYTAVMSARRWLGIVILGICLVGPVAEAFDWWDQAQPPGNDTEAGTVVVALSLGLAIAVASIVVRWFQSFATGRLSARWLHRPHLVRAGAFPRPCPTSSPPTPLRI